MRRLGWLACVCLAACEAAVDDLADGVLVLPGALREVSAIAVVDERTIACVQDEVGALFFVDLEGRLPPRVAAFGEPGDYEGLARTGDDYWVLRSDGRQVQLREHAGRLEVVRSTHLPREYAEWEGLCFDVDRGVLLALPKARAGTDKASRDERPLFAVDLATGVARAEPVVVLRRRALLEQAEQRGIELPMRTTPKGKERVALELVGSEILAVPGTDEWLLLSAVDHVLLRLDRTGRLLGCRRLDAGELPQPEGMALLPDGRLLVASEGRGGPGVVRVVPRD